MIFYQAHLLIEPSIVFYASTKEAAIKGLIIKYSNIFNDEYHWFSWKKDLISDMKTLNEQDSISEILDKIRFTIGVNKIEIDTVCIVEKQYKEMLNNIIVKDVIE